MWYWIATGVYALVVAYTVLKYWVIKKDPQFDYDLSGVVGTLLVATIIFLAFFSVLVPRMIDGKYGWSIIGGGLSALALLCAWVEIYDVGAILPKIGDAEGWIVGRGGISRCIVPVGLIHTFGFQLGLYRFVSGVHRYKFVAQAQNMRKLTVEVEIRANWRKVMASPHDRLDVYRQLIARIKRVWPNKVQTLVKGYGIDEIATDLAKSAVENSCELFEVTVISAKLFEPCKKVDILEETGVAVTSSE